VTILASIFSVCFYISVVGTYYRYEGLASLINYLILFYIVINLASRKDISLFLKAIIIVGGMVALYGIFQYFGYDFLSRLYKKIRVNSTFGNPVFFACYVMMTFLITLGLYFSQKVDKKQDFLYLIATSLMLFALFLTKTRACIIGLFFGCIFFFIILFKYLILNQRQKFIQALGILGTVTVILSLHPEISPLGRFLKIFKAKPSMATQEETIPIQTQQEQVLVVEDSFKSGSEPTRFEGTARIRLFVWKDSLKIIKDNLLLGIGPEVMDIVYPKYRGIEHVRTAGGPYLRCDRAHNEILDTTVSKGILGLLTYFGLFFTIFFFFLKFYKRLQKQSKPILLGLFSGILAYLIQAQFSFSNIPTSLLLWLIIACFIYLILPFTRQRFIKIKTSTFGVILLILGIFLMVTIIPPYIADIFYHKGKIAEELGKEEHALVNFEKAFKIYPYEKRYPAVLIKTYLDLGQKTNDINLVNRAKAVAEATIRRLPQEPVFYNILGVVLGTLSSFDGKDRTQERLKLYKKSAELDPNSPDVHYNLGLIYAALGDYNSAITEYKKAVFLTEGGELYLHKLGMLYLKLNDINSAIQTFEELANKRPNYSQILEVYNKLCELYYKKKNIKKFIKYSHKILEINPNDFLTCKNMGIVYFQQGFYKEAKFYLKRAKDINPNDTVVNNLLYKLAS
jgi:tetratricopeptide (TPR) repeat protein